MEQTARFASPAILHRQPTLPRLHVLAIGGSHQLAHFLPVAFELERRGALEVTVFVPNQADRAEVALLADELQRPLPRIVVMDLPRPIENWIPRQLDKLARLLVWGGAIRSGTAILCAERTSTLLKRLPGRCPGLVHIPHGAGDGAVGFEKRFRLFDLVIVAGAKDRDRLLAAGVVRPDRCEVAGPVKVAAMIGARRSRQRLFPNNRPTILYNPHFNRSLSSAELFTRRLVEAVKAEGRYNLIVAPHIRMARSWSPGKRQEWERLAQDNEIIVDLGSRRSIDMTYTLDADLYIGDVSSQVYEYLVRPRPCLFVNAHSVDWERSEDYAMWRLGEVVSPDCDVAASIDRAFARHSSFRPHQMERIGNTLHGVAWDAAGAIDFASVSPIARAADIAEAFTHRRFAAAFSPVLA